MPTTGQQHGIDRFSFASITPSSSKDTLRVRESGGSGPPGASSLPGLEGMRHEQALVDDKSQIGLSGHQGRACERRLYVWPGSPRSPRSLKGSNMNA
jgi:hypothetical protein